MQIKAVFEFPNILYWATNATHDATVVLEYSTDDQFCARVNSSTIPIIIKGA